MRAKIDLRARFLKKFARYRSYMSVLSLSYLFLPGKACFFPRTNFWKSMGLPKINESLGGLKTQCVLIFAWDLNPGWCCSKIGIELLSLLSFNDETFEQEEKQIGKVLFEVFLHWFKRRFCVAFSFQEASVTQSRLALIYCVW